jgi:hypothetical protein
MLLTVLRLVTNQKYFIRHSSSSYIQGQAPPDRPDLREYFYYIDSFGQVRYLSLLALFYEKFFFIVILRRYSI